MEADTLAQSIAVAFIVAGCVLYAAWTLMPAAGRRRIALRLLSLPLPRPVVAVMRRHASAASGCGCEGCDKSTSKAPTAPVQTIRFHPRPPR